MVYVLYEISGKGEASRKIPAIRGELAYLRTSPMSVKFRENRRRAVKYKYSIEQVGALFFQICFQRIGNQLFKLQCFFLYRPLFIRFV